MSTPSPLSPDQFPAFFEALWGYEPFPWQVEFATRLCAGAAPDYVTVPTGSGKTACLDGAVFSLAVQAALPPAERTTGRRIFFIVNRRIIVDEAYERAKVLARKFKDALTQEGSLIAQAAWWLLKLAGGEETTPLGYTELRGGIYRDRAWARSLVQPMIVCSTVDQAGSRLLFRGYGVSPEARPLHAALVAQDSLLLVDEAHISQPFIETLRWVKRYRTFHPPTSETVALPFSLICLTATPPQNHEEKPSILGLADLTGSEHPILKSRLTCAKLARLIVEPKAKGKQWHEMLANRLAKEAESIIRQNTPRSLAIIVNRVATARAIYTQLKEKYSSANVTLLLGRMRPLDRDKITRELQAELKTARPTSEQSTEAPLRIVVSTQCLEVGADLDFEALVTECASLDALRQRFGRLNRSGRPITAHAAIVLPEEQNANVAKLSEEKPLDPIYGNAIPRTWAWLQSIATNGSVDFGIASMSTAVDSLRAADEEGFSAMLMPVSQAPILLPAYLDCWVQTNPAPAVEPDVSLFLHGPQRDMAEVQVCWRSDLPDEADEQTWAETLALCPPTALECLPVPLALVRRWMENGGDITDTTGDAPQASTELKDDHQSSPLAVQALIWRGADASQLIRDPRWLRPGDTLVLRTQDGGWSALGHISGAPELASFPEAAKVDEGENGQMRMHRRAFVRLHTSLWDKGPEDSPAWRLMEWAANSSESALTDGELRHLIRNAADSVAGNASLSARLLHLAGAKRLRVEPYPSQCGAVISTPELLPSDTTADSTVSDDSGDDPLTESSEPQTLSEHSSQVTSLASRYAESLGLAAFRDAIEKAAALHDAGKADRRFQALLIGGDVPAALALPIPLAKSAGLPNSQLARDRTRQRATLPAGFRHEMLSMQLASSAAADQLLPSEELRRLLTLHLIASHHGHARPFAPVVEDDTPPPVSVNLSETHLSLTGPDRIALPAHALDSGISERFWRLVRHHGWWGLTLLEAVLRSADQTASAIPYRPNENERAR